MAVFLVLCLGKRTHYSIFKNPQNYGGIHKLLVDVGFARIDQQLPYNSGAEVNPRSTFLGIKINGKSRVSCSTLFAGDACAVTRNASFVTRRHSQSSVKSRQDQSSDLDDFASDNGSSSASSMSYILYNDQCQCSPTNELLLQTPSALTSCSQIPASGNQGSTT